jgi:uncharacterized membrane protein (UPF0136 family)
VVVEWVFQAQVLEDADSENGTGERNMERLEGSTVNSVPRRDRLIAALSHLGVPIYGPLLPLGIFFGSKSSSFRQNHASQGFSFQCAFMGVYIVLFALYVVEILDDVVIILALLAAVALEAPNVIRAMRGRPPVPVIPVVLLRPAAPASTPLPPPRT